jgi:mRNA interferase HigB
MRIISLSTLKAFWEETTAYTDAIEPTLAWYHHTLKANWDSPNCVKRDFGNASILKDGRVVFNIAGNKYRLIVKINYSYRIIYIRFIGTHKQYDRIDAGKI